MATFHERGERQRAQRVRNIWEVEALLELNDLAKEKGEGKQVECS